MSNFGLILICLALGMILRRARKLPEQAPAALNGFIFMISLPAVALLSLNGIEFDSSLLYPVSMAWIVFAAACVGFTLLCRALGWSRGTLGALILTGGLGNTSFVGFPLLIALYGTEALTTGVLTDQPGTFLVLSSAGVVGASLLASREPFSARRLIQKLISFPPFVAMLVSLALHSWPYPEAIRLILEKLSATLVPLALVSVGMQIRLSPAVLRRRLGALSLGLFFKLGVAPALISLLFVTLLGVQGQAIQITIAQAAMAPMITGAVLADEYGLDPELANLMVAIGIPLSLLTVPLWAYLVGFV